MTSTAKHNSLAIFFLSVFSLFIELALIRWIGTEVSIFAYLQNTLLVTCFIGLGLGMLKADLKYQLSFLPAGICFLLIVTCLSFPYTRNALQNVSLLLSKTGELTVWNEQLSNSPTEAVLSVALGLAAMAVILFVVIEVFFPVGALLGQLIGQAENRSTAYSINLVGSLCGAWSFIACGRLLLGPVSWCVIAVALVLATIASRRLSVSRLHLIYFILIISVASIQPAFSGAVKTYWSPYQKIELYKLTKDLRPFQYTVLVNNFPFQSIADRTDEMLWQDPRILYDVPPLFRPGAESALVVGAGTGNDVAGMLDRKSVV